MVEFSIESSSDHDGSKRKPGICGLVNLGNTCYMNSIIQCLSNCPPLTEYFLKNRHLQDLNTRNPMGMNGEIARSFGELIRNLWSGEENCLKPTSFKYSVSRFNHQFKGWSQHDAQELLTFLLDGLNEDLNRVVRKPEVPGAGEPLKDRQLAFNSWEKHLMRNDSIIVETFHGLLKSSVVCPACETLSITFDPFCSLSLPLPNVKEKKFVVHYIPQNPTKTGSTFQVGVLSRSNVKDLLLEVALKMNVDPRTLLPAQVNDYHVEKIFIPGESISHIHGSEVFVYEIPHFSNDPNNIVIPVCFWNLDDNQKVSIENGFGVPLLLSLCISDIADGRIGNLIMDNLRKRPFHRFVIEGVSPEIYIIDLSHKRFAQSNKLEFSRDGKCLSDTLSLLELDKRDKIYSRKMIFVNLNFSSGVEYIFNAPSCAEPSHREPDDKRLTIFDCLEMFTSFEKLGPENAWYCPKCREQQRATKKFDVWMSPRILVLHLKRFSAEGEKLETAVEFPLSGLDMGPFIAGPGHLRTSYDLIAVVNHYGSLGGGHYTAYCKNYRTDSWFCFNDQVVSPIVSSKVVTSSAYVLFYLRNDQEHDS